MSEQTPEQKAAAEELSKQLLESFGAVQLSVMAALAPLLTSTEAHFDQIRTIAGPDSAKSVARAFHAMLGRALMEQAVYMLIMASVKPEDARELYENLWRMCTEFDPVARQEMAEQRSADKVGEA